MDERTRSDRQPAETPVDPVEAARAVPGNGAQATESGSSRLGLAIVCILLGAGIGPAFYILLTGIESYAASIFSFVLGIFVASGIAVAVGAVTALLLAPRLFGDAKSTLNGIIAELGRAGRAYVRDEKEAVISHIASAADNAAAWYSIKSVRRFAGSSAIALIVALGGTVTSVLLLTQTALLRDQNKKIDLQVELLSDQNSKLDQQTFTAEAQRRGALTAALFDVLKDASQELSKEKPGILSDGLKARLIALSRSSQPYLFIDIKNVSSDGSRRYAPELIKTPLSPERGQLLVGLVSAGADLQSLARVGVTFDGADLRNAQLESANLTALSLAGADFSNARLDNADFSGSNLFAAQFTHAQANNAIFDNANIVTARLADTHLRKASFVGATLSFVDFEEASLESADFTGAKMRGLLKFDGAIVEAHDKSDRPKDYPKGLQRPPEGFREVRVGDWVRLKAIEEDQTAKHDDRNADGAAKK